MGYEITINVANTADKAGIKIIVYFMKSFSYPESSLGSFVYASVFPIKKITAPAENLSNKLYIPNTKAPVLALVPTTSEIKLIPVARTIV